MSDRDADNGSFIDDTGDLESTKSEAADDETGDDDIGDGVTDDDDSDDEESDDEVDRCGSCAWEIVVGECVGCGMEYEESDEGPGSQRADDAGLPDAIWDDEDHSYRCSSCTWQVVDGACVQCGTQHELDGLRPVNEDDLSGTSSGSESEGDDEDSDEDSHDSGEDCYERPESKDESIAPAEDHDPYKCVCCDTKPYKSARISNCGHVFCLDCEYAMLLNKDGNGVFGPCVECGTYIHRLDYMLEDEKIHPASNGTRQPDPDSVASDCEVLTSSTIDEESDDTDQKHELSATAKQHKIKEDLKEALLLREINEQKIADLKAELCAVEKSTEHQEREQAMKKSRAKERDAHIAEEDSTQRARKIPHQPRK
ncbi:hypothetical protein BT63DRAFT_32216 [Microthyrium microscopicum]|uniref:RING-type domain-containing protein n=1 Tax=Microthyrium microscopicum TaxID=703497 RepID=A0A6A6UTT5_9PEZI|nr:hypothetical protein BT63DRAFT_32216 [Microthyrium microscopicum]